jgi:LysM repeat protein
VHTKNITNIVFVWLLRVFLLAALVVSLAPPIPVNAQASAAMDLINAVNAYRASVGLEPYSVDSGLMSLAQAQSEYQASILNCTHNRSDGSGPGDQGISAENIACGVNVSAQGALQQWTDALHTATMLGPTTGLVGAGVATSGSNVYYTLDVKRLTGDFNYQPPPATVVSAAAVQQQQATSQPVYGIVVSTPNSDGSIVHIIQYGETLVEIAQAYGISLNELISLNKLDPKKPVYYARQPLIIRLAFTLTPYMTTTFTPRPPTRTPLPTRTPRPTKTATPDYTTVPSRTTTSAPPIQLPTLDELGPARPIMAYAFIGISAIGLLVLLFTAFGREKRG